MILVDCNNVQCNCKHERCHGLLIKPNPSNNNCYWPLITHLVTPTFCHTRGVGMTPHSCLTPSHPDVRPQNVIFNRLTVKPQTPNSFILLLIYRYIHIDIFLIQSFLKTTNTVNKFYFPQLFYHTSPVYPHNNTNCDVSTTRCHTNCIYIYNLLILC